MREHIESSIPLVTGIIVAEVCAKFGRDQKPPQMAVVALRSSASLLPIDFEVGYQTAQVYQQQRRIKPKFSMADAHIVAAARIHNARILTCDLDFSGISEAIIIK